MPQRKALAVFALLSMATAPVQAATVGPGSQIIGKAYNTLPIATPENVSLGVELVKGRIATMETSVNNGLQAIRQGQQEQVAAETKLLEALGVTIRDVMVQQGVAQEKAEAQRTYGPQSKAPSACGTPELGSGVQVGKAAEGKVSRDITTALKTHGSKWGKHDDIAKHYATIPKEKVTPEKLFPEKGTLTVDEVKDAKLMGELLTNPSPTLKLSEAVQKTSSGQSYELISKIKETRLAVPQKVVSDTIAAHSPTMELGDWAIDAWQSMGGSGTPEGVVDGKISPVALLNLMTDMRFSNPNWYKALNGGEMNEMAIKREQLMMAATSMEMQRRQLILLQQIAMMMAENQSAQTNAELNPVLQNFSNQATSEAARRK